MDAKKSLANRRKPNGHNTTKRARTMFSSGQHSQLFIENMSVYEKFETFQRKSAQSDAC